MNKPVLQATIFTNHPQCDGSFGWRIYDDEGQAYDNTLTAEQMTGGDLELLKIALKSLDECAAGIFAWMQEHEEGMHIGSTYYQWDQIKHLWSDEG